MVVIRLARGGSKKAPFYHVVVTDKRNPRDGRYIENVGFFNPMARGKETRLTLNQELIREWVNKGAQPSARVNSLIKEFAGYAEKAPEAAPTKVEIKQAQAKAAIEQARKKLEEEKAAAAAAAKEEAKAEKASAESEAAPEEKAE